MYNMECMKKAKSIKRSGSDISNVYFIRKIKKKNTTNLNILLSFFFKLKLRKQRYLKRKFKSLKKVFFVRKNLYANLLNEYRIFSTFYSNINLKGFKKLLFNLKFTKSSFIESFILNLESRLDIIIFRLCLSSLSMSYIKQLISHGFFLVNGKVVNKIGFKLNQLDVLSCKFSNFFFWIYKSFLINYKKLNNNVDFYKKNKQKVFSKLYNRFQNYNSLNNVVLLKKKIRYFTGTYNFNFITYKLSNKETFLIEHKNSFLSALFFKKKNVLSFVNLEEFKVLKRKLVLVKKYLSGQKFLNDISFKFNHQIACYIQTINKNNFNLKLFVNLTKKKKKFVYVFFLDDLKKNNLSTLYLLVSNRYFFSWLLIKKLFKFFFYF